MSTGRLELYVDGFSRASSTVAATRTSALFGIYRWGFSTSQDFNGGRVEAITRDAADRRQTRAHP